jgi:hypothetical protein
LAAPAASSISAVAPEGDYVMKLDGVTGAHVWSRPVAANGAINAEAITVNAAGDVILAGEFSGTVDFGGGSLVGSGNNDVFVAWFDQGGAYRWSKGFAGTQLQQVHGVATDSADHVLFAGRFFNTIDFGGGPLVSAGFYDVFAVKLSP